MSHKRTARSRVVTLAVGALVAAALAGPSGAYAGQSAEDPTNGGDWDQVDPPPYGDAPDQPHNTGSATPCTWLVKGRLYVQAPTLDGIADHEPLAGVEIKVSGADSVGSAANVFGKWGTTHTDANGEFSLSHDECHDRRVRVEARFSSADGDLRVLGPASPEWYVLKDTNDVGDVATIDLKGEPFGGETGDQATSQARTDAQTWIFYRKAIDYLASIKSPMLNDLTVHNPASTAPNGSWTDPVLHGIHIDPQFTNDPWNLAHELGHAEAYPREDGEDCLTWALSDGSTHDFEEKPCVAFNEGFGDFFASKLLTEMGDAGLITLPGYHYETKPYTRSHLVKKGLDDVYSAEHNELGWDQAFRVLTSSDVTSRLFGDGEGKDGKYVGDYAGSCAGVGAPTGKDDLADAIRVIGDASDQFGLQNGQNPSFFLFFERAVDRLGGFDPADSDRYQQIVAPTSDVEPHELYGC